MNERLKKIREYQKKGSARRADSVFVAEGIKMAGEMPWDRVLNVVLSRSFCREEPELAAHFRGLSERNGTGFDVVTDEEFEKLSDTKTPQGILAVLRFCPCTEEEILEDRNGLFMLLENLSDPGNLGTILRASEAAGVSGVILSRGSADITNPKVVRSTMGSFFRMRFAVSEDLKASVKRIRELGGHVYAAHLRDSVPYDEADYRGMTAFLIGNESSGLTDEITEAADSCVKIPMEGRVESLNAAMAATILMFEAKRQRKLS